VAVAPPAPTYAPRDTIAGGSSSPGSTQVEFGSISGSVERSPRPASNRPRVERTTRGLRIYPNIESDEEERHQPQRREPVRVLRALPVEPGDRERAEGQGVRVYRAEPYRRQPTAGRIIRVMPVDEEQ
jgi:hypothetical protein